MKVTCTNKVWIMLWIVLMHERRLTMQKSKKHNRAIAHILTFCLVNFRTNKTNHDPLTLFQQGISWGWSLQPSAVILSDATKESEPGCGLSQWMGKPPEVGKINAI
jgi:hypothetical protein